VDQLFIEDETLETPECVLGSGSARGKEDFPVSTK